MAANLKELPTLYDLDQDSDYDDYGEQAYAAAPMAAAQAPKPKRTMFGSGPVSMADITGDRTVAHAQHKKISAALKADTGLSEHSALLAAAGLEDRVNRSTLEGDEVAVFAPTNEAWASAENGALVLLKGANNPRASKNPQAVQRAKAALRSVVKQHIIPNHNLDSEMMAHASMQDGVKLSLHYSDDDAEEPDTVAMYNSGTEDGYAVASAKILGVTRPRGSRFAIYSIDKPLLPQ